MNSYISRYIYMYKLRLILTDVAQNLFHKRIYSLCVQLINI